VSFFKITADTLVELAKQDGFGTNLQADGIEKELLKNGGKTGLWDDI